jgi:malonyl-CoA/methylmalonyl-CoA synthetase
MSAEQGSQDTRIRPIHWQKTFAGLNPMTALPFVARARLHRNFVAFRTQTSTRTYQDLLDCSAKLAAALLGDARDFNERRVALLVPAGFKFVAAQWAIWRAGGIMVPISLSATEPEWEYALTNSGADIVLADTELGSKLAPLCSRLELRLVDMDAITSTTMVTLPDIAPKRRAMILYTSGTTSKPKGVVTTHANIQAQIESLVEAWEWSETDRIPLFLPLHHIHGIINVTGCALWSGATIEPFARFDLPLILDHVRADAYTIFMAVPTIYVKLIQALEAASPEDRAAWVDGFAKMRLMVSGSAALPASVHAHWTALTGQKLLERYGMTEIGMAISNPYRGERRAGAVGKPLPGVEVRLKAEGDIVVIGEEEPGEIQVRGPGVFCGYWNRPAASVESFDDGWFRTGDMAVSERGYYRILGRLSVDIIKSGGFKLSALEIEAALLEHAQICECAVIGIPDETWGEAVTVAVVLRAGSALDLATLREWCRSRLSAYKIPRRLLVVQELPRNAMGKVTKPAVRELF